MANLSPTFSYMSTPPPLLFQVLTSDEIAMLGQEEEEEEEEQPLNQPARAKYDFTAKSNRELSFKKVRYSRVFSD